MILFKKDFSKIPHRIDYQTSNKSFLDMAAMLKQMGVKNYYFHLVIYDPDLIGVDPYSPLLSPQMMSKIFIECRRNPFYFFREVARVSSKGSPNGAPVILNRALLAEIWLFFNNIDMFIAQPRQTGKSTFMNFIYILLLYIIPTKYSFGLLTKDASLRARNLKEVKEMRDLLPTYLIFQTKDDPDNTQIMNAKAEHLQNTFYTEAARVEVEAAEKIYRGFPIPKIFFDEFAYIKNLQHSFPAIIGSMSAALAQARSNNLPYGIVAATTTRGLETAEGRFAHSKFKEAATWDELFYDCEDRQDLINKINANLGSTRASTSVNVSMSHRQLGFSDEWMIDVIKRSSGTEASNNVDYFLVWASNGEESPFTDSTLAAIAKSVKEPEYKRFEERTGLLFKFFQSEFETEKLLRTQPIILGIDTSEGVGRDSISGVFLNPYGLDTIGTFRTNRANIQSFGNVIIDLMKQYPNLLVIPERKSTGVGLVDQLLIELPAHGIDPFKRIFNTIVQNSRDKYNEFKEITKPLTHRSESFYNMRKQAFGYTTTASSRKVLYEQVIKYALDNAKDQIHDKQLADELRALKIINGRLDHEEGMNDDTVIAWLLAQFVVRLGKNLRYYGIDPTLITNAINERRMSTLGSDRIRLIENNQSLLQEAIDISNRIKRSENDNEIARLLTHLKRIEGSVDKEVLRELNLNISFDDVINKTKENKRINRIAAGRVSSGGGILSRIVF